MLTEKYKRDSMDIAAEYWEDWVKGKSEVELQSKVIGLSLVVKDFSNDLADKLMEVGELKAKIAKLEKEIAWYKETYTGVIEIKNLKTKGV